MRVNNAQTDHETPDANQGMDKASVTQKETALAALTPEILSLFRRGYTGQIKAIEAQVKAAEGQIEALQREKRSLGRIVAAIDKMNDLP